jgi:hypothetical protein
MTDDVRKLLGGYATGTLSDEEKQFLYNAALQDDELFAALADEQALKELLDDGAVRAQLLRATEEPKFSLAGAFREWFDQPKAKALVATGAVLIAIIGFNTMRQPVEEKHEQVAEVRQQAPSAPEPISQSPTQPKRPVARKATKPKVEKDEPAIRQAPTPEGPPPQPAETLARGVVGGVVGGAVGGAVSSVRAAPMRLKEQASADSSLPLRYELLLKEADGEFRPVPAGHAFTTGDLLRIRVTSTRNGAVAVSTPGQATVSGGVTANQATSLPSSGGIVINADTRALVLSFAADDATTSLEIPIPRPRP